MLTLKNKNYNDSEAPAAGYANEERDFVQLIGDTHYE